VNTEEIRQMRDLLAAQPAPTQTRPPGLRRKLTSLLTGKSPPCAKPFAIPTAAKLAPTEPETELLLFTPDPTPSEPIPPELLLGGLAPRRPAFGQRVEGVLELEAPAPAEPRRLILCAAGGEAVGEIILHAPASALHAETPFFPEDLADEAFPRSKRQPDEPPVQKSAAPPAGPELAATFLLANLAARLASEEAALTHRLTTAQSLSQAA
jgi:hypothetical protein